MKLGVRPVKGAEQFEVDVNLEDRSEDVKAKIAALYPQFPMDQQKLICSGKILADGARLQDQGVAEGSFLVLMLNKPKAQESTAQTSESTPEVAVQPPAPQPPAPLETPEYAQQIAMLVGMGFPASEVEACMRAAHGNPDRAYEFLVGGIPAAVQAPLPTPPMPTPAPEPAPQQIQQPPGGGNPVEAMMEALRRANANASSSNANAPPPAAVDTTGPFARIKMDPSWNHMRHAIQKNPQSLNEVIMHMMKIDPNIVQVIMQNQEEFVRSLQEPAMPIPEGARPSRPRLPELSPADQEAINELMAFGFDKAKATQAYLLAEKDKDRAASLLFDGAV